MTAININIEEFMKVLADLSEEGVVMVNLDMIPDENHPSMNKIIIHPIRTDNNSYKSKQKIITRNPDISTDNNDIFNLFDGIV